jgi:hypothetical protein
VEDNEYVDSYMNQQPWKAGRFAHSLRLSLWSEHLGLRRLEVCNFLVEGLKHVANSILVFSCYFVFIETNAF